jgi:hypothetical protein
MKQRVSSMSSGGEGGIRTLVTVLTLKAPKFGSAEVEALHSDNKPATQNLLSSPNFLWSLYFSPKHGFSKRVNQAFLVSQIDGKWRRALEAYVLPDTDSKKPASTVCAPAGKGRNHYPVQSVGVNGRCGAHTVRTYLTDLSQRNFTCARVIKNAWNIVAQLGCART